MAPASCLELLDPERLFAPFASSKKLLLAVSGGPDSVALMLLAARWSGRSAIPLEVATVDHRLREGSRAEAETVAGWARVLGFVHHLLTWQGEKPETRLQEVARAARYGLLEECATRVGADHILTAHHADDQAETVLLRLTRGSGPAGLAGMALFAALGQVTLARPLLCLPKRHLVALCEAAGHPFLRDPSNESPAFARTRLRRLRGLLDAEGLSRGALLRLARRAARAEAALAAITASTQLTLRAERGQGRVKFAGEALAPLAEEIFLRVLEAEILGLTPAHDRLRLERLERMAAEVGTALRNQRAMAATLGGARIAVTSAGDVEITVAPARRPHHVRPKETTIPELTARGGAAG